jgi:glutamyl-tRNA synthetase
MLNILKSKLQVFQRLLLCHNIPWVYSKYYTGKISMSLENDKVVTRFAPSPTGFLHIGGARTALFNWLFTRNKGGTFYLRIEDTDRKRSTTEAIEAILDGMNWLGLNADAEPVYQFSCAERHVEVANQLVLEGKAYKCYASPDELTEMREKAKAEGNFVGYDGRWRDRDPSEAPEGVSPAIRLKSPLTGETVIEDKVLGTITVNNEELDDMILLRSDGTPTYMLSVVVDDHDMGITHIIRGNDHMRNASRQALLYIAMGWDIPVFAHIPLIHGPDGAKLSKRHGALGVDAYRDMGYLPEAVRNYLCRLGWSHGDDEIFSTTQAIEWFSLEGINKSASRFDFQKLENINGHYIKTMDEAELFEAALPFLEKELNYKLEGDNKEIFKKALKSLKERAKNLVDLAASARFYFEFPSKLDAKTEKALNDEGKNYVGEVKKGLTAIDTWSADNMQGVIMAVVEKNEVGFGKVAQPLRAALTGTMSSAGGVTEIMVNLGKEKSLKRLENLK